MTGGDRAGGGPRSGARGAAWTTAPRTHPLVVLLVVVVAVGVVVAAIAVFVPGATKQALDRTNPYRAEYGGLRALRAGLPPSHVESLLGTADSVDPLCAVAVCPAYPGVAATVHVYRGDHSVVRAVFQDEQLAAYLVTTTARDFTPRITWLSVDFGRLGRATFSQVLPSNGAPEPSDASVLLGPGVTSYAEVLMGGGASRYEGFLLGRAPGGYGGPGMTWDLEGARELEAWQIENPEGGLDPDVAREFRSGSLPNTYGAFRDEGPLSSYFREAENVRVLLTSPAPS